MSNRLIFKNFLQEKSLVMEEVQEADGGVFFRTRQSFKNGGSVSLAFSFEKDDGFVDLSVFHVATITNPLKMELIHKLINDLNVHYRYAKFFEDEGDITVQYPIALNPDDLDPKFLFEMMGMLVRSAEEAYPKFMKLQWA